MQLQKRDMRTVRFADAVYTRTGDWAEIIGRFPHLWMKKHCGSPKLTADYSPIYAWYAWM